MKIEEAVKQLRNIARVENGEISIGKGLDREMNELTHYIIVAVLKNGYTLCKVDEAVEKMENIDISERKTSVWDSGEISAITAIERCINILKEACK